MFLMLRPPPTSPLFPYTTLFRSPLYEVGAGLDGRVVAHRLDRTRWNVTDTRSPSISTVATQPASRAVSAASSRSSGSVPPRSEEHTSELQSRRDLVCRLLLEKKK